MSDASKAILEFEDYWSKSGITAADDSLHIHKGDSGLEEWNKEPLTKGKTADRGLHLELMPIPYVGNIKGADIVLLMLNPSFTEADKLWQNECGGKAALLESYKKLVACNWALSAKLNCLSWFNYYAPRLLGAAYKVKRFKEMCIQDVLDELSTRVVILELFPYHASNFSSYAASRRFREFESVKQALKLAKGLSSDKGRLLLSGWRADYWPGVDKKPLGQGRYQSWKDEYLLAHLEKPAGTQSSV